MADKEKLRQYYHEICKALNEKGFKKKLAGNLVEYTVDDDYPEMTITEVTDDIDAYRFLNQEGLIRKDICHFCGESPVDGTYTFTEPRNQIAINICKNCHPQGKKASNNSGGGCLLLILLLLIPITSLIIWTL